MLPQLDCLATLAKTCFNCFDVAQVVIQWCHACKELYENVRLSFADLVAHAPSVAARPRSVDFAYDFPDRRWRLRDRLDQALLSFGLYLWSV